MALVRVFRLPTAYPSGYCHNGGKPVVMVLVDWFRVDEGGMFPLPKTGTPDWISNLTRFVQGKRYFDPTMPFLVMHPEHTFTIGYHG